MTTSSHQLLKLLNCLREVHPEFPLTYAAIVAEVALQPGSPQAALADKIGSSASTLSRMITALSNPSGPYKLLKVSPHPTSRREHRIDLTASGQRLIDRIEARIKS